MFIKSEKHPSPPFTSNYLTHKTLNKKVKGEGLKTLFIYTRGKGNNPFFHFSDFPVFPKILKKEYNIRFKIYPSPFTSSPQHISIIVFPTFVWFILQRYSAIFRSNFRVIDFRKSYRLTSGRANSLPPTTIQPNESQNKK